MYKTQSVTVHYMEFVLYTNSFIGIFLLLFDIPYNIIIKCDDIKHDGLMSEIL